MKRGIPAIPIRTFPLTTMRGGTPVDGQNGGYRPRTAGERTGVPGADGGVRDWQKNTWFGPAPLNNNPFDEPEDAPELRESRSENVTEHVGEFWNTPDRGYVNPHNPGKYTESNTRIRNEKRKIKPDLIGDPVLRQDKCYEY